MGTGDGSESSLIRGLAAGFSEIIFDAVVAFDTQERITLWNRAAEQTFGWTAQEALGRTPAELFWPVDMPLEQEDKTQRQARLARGETLRGELTLCRKDGASFPVQFTTRAIFDAEGKLKGNLAVYRDSSAQVQARENEEKLKRSNQRLSEILSSIQDDFYVLNRDWVFVFASRTFTSRIGKEPGDFVGNNIWEMFPKHVGGILYHNFHAAMEKREIRRFELPGKYTDAWYRMNVFPSEDGITVIGTDITENKRAEQALRESEERYRHLVKYAPAAIYEIDIRSMHFTEVNDSMCEILGYTREELLSIRPEDLMDEESRGRFRDRILQTLSGEKISEQIEYKVRTKDGHELWAVLNTTINYDHGMPKSVSVIAHDVTERKLAEAALRESEERYRGIVESTHEGVWILDLDGATTFVNAQMAALLGYTPQEMLGRSAFDFVVDSDRARGQAEWENRQEKSGGQQSVFGYRHKDGHTVWCLVTSNIIADGQGRTLGFLGMFSDITERKRAEDALRESERQLQLLNESLEQKVQEKTAEVRRLASDTTKAVQRERHRISHILHDDLQQRIYAIQMQLTFLRYELQDESEAARNELSDIERQLGEILDITRHLSIDLSPPILRDEGLAQAINWLAGQIRQRYGLPVEVQADGPFAIPDEALHVFLFNCVRELLFNAVKHSGASQVVVALQWLVTGLQIEVRDNGMGFRVNTPGQQLSEDTSQEDELQSGFGLPTIRKQLSLFEGRMEIQSEPGSGTQVILFVPVPTRGE